MRIAAITAFRYRLPLRAPLALGGCSLAAREGLLVRVTGDDGSAGWGDVAPLPGFSPESVDEARRSLQARAPSLAAVDASAALDSLARWKGPSSGRCGLELALFDAQARARGTTLPHALHEAPRPAVSFNALLTDTDEALREAADRLRADGYRAVKLKVGRRPLEEDIARVRAAAEALGDVALRLDANRAWSADAATRFAEMMAEVPIEYIEEPLADAAALPAWADATGCPVALDETIQEGASPRDHPYAAAVILKPTLVGGVQAAQRLAREAHAVGAQPVLSASFESGVGLRGLVALAAGLGPEDTPVGLDTYRRLADDVFAPRLPLEGPRVAVDALFAHAETVNAAVIQDEHSML